MIFDHTAFEEFVPESNTEPSATEIQRYTEPLERFFHEKKGFKRTELTRSVLPLIARANMSILNPDKYQLPKRGVAMFGNVGTGKTVLLRLASMVLQINMVEVSELSVKFSRQGPDGFWLTVGTPNKFFMLDDLGAEPDSKNYGNTIPTIDLIYERYAAFKRGGARPWITSNLKQDELTARYGERGVDRIKEMCEIVSAPGESLRK